MFEKYITNNIKIRNINLKKPFFFSFIQVSTSFINLVFLDFISKIYSLEVVGLLSFIISFAALPTMIIGCGFNQIVIIHITNKNKTFSEILSINFISRLIVIIPSILILSFLLNLEINNIFACLLLASEIAKNVLPTLLIDEMKLTHLITYSSFLEKLILIILIKFFFFESSFDIVLVFYSLIQLISIISLSILLFKYFPAKNLKYNFKDIKNEIYNSFKGIPNILSQFTFGHLVKIFLGYVGDYEFLAKFTIGSKLINVLLLPLNYYFRIITSNLNSFAAKIKKQLIENKSLSIQNIFAESTIITTLYFLFSTVIICIFLNVKELRDIFPNILGFKGLLPLSLMLILYESLCKFGDALEQIIIGVKGRKLVLKSFLPGTIFSLFFNIFGLVIKNKAYMIFGMFFGYLLVFINMYNTINNWTYKFNNVPPNKNKI